MAEEIKKEGSQEPNYLEQALEANQNLKEQLQSTREEMARMAEDNKTIMKQLLEGGEVNKEPEDTRPIVDVIKSMRRDNINDLEFAKEALAYREKCIAQGHGDPFVGKGDKYDADEAEQAKAENLAKCLAHCIEYAEGDNSVFLNELNRITVDIPGGKFINNNRR